MDPTKATFTLTAETLTRTIANANARERRRLASMVDDMSDAQLGAGAIMSAELLRQVAEVIRTAGPKHTADVGDGDLDYHRAAEEIEAVQEPIAEDELPPVRHMDDFEEGSSLVRSGADRRLVHGYSGAQGHLRD